MKKWQPIYTDTHLLQSHVCFANPFAEVSTISSAAKVLLWQLLMSRQVCKCFSWKNLGSDSQNNQDGCNSLQPHCVTFQNSLHGLLKQVWKPHMSESPVLYPDMSGWDLLFSLSPRTTLDKNFKVFLSEYIEVRNVKADGGKMSNVLTHRLK